MTTTTGRTGVIVLPYPVGLTAGPGVVVDRYASSVDASGVVAVLERNVRAAVRPVATRPSRYNFAGYCIHCEELGCTSQRCATYHESSKWQICPRCNGRGVDPVTDRGCGLFCLLGVVEVCS